MLPQQSQDVSADKESFLNNPSSHCSKPLSPSGDPEANYAQAQTSAKHVIRRLASVFALAGSRARAQTIAKTAAVPNQRRLWRQSGVAACGQCVRRCRQSGRTGASPIAVMRSMRHCALQKSGWHARGCSHPLVFPGCAAACQLQSPRPLRADNLLQSESRASFGCAWAHTQPCPTQTHSGRPAATTAHYSRSSGPFRNSDKTRIKNGGIFRISVGFPCMLRHSSVCVSFRPAPFIYQLSRWRAPSSRLP